jgi:hypothetical protein
MEPVDGYTVEHSDILVTLTLSNRYGSAERYEFTRMDAYQLGRALIEHAEGE